MTLSYAVCITLHNVVKPPQEGDAGGQECDVELRRCRDEYPRTTPLSTERQDGDDEAGVMKMTQDVAVEIKTEGDKETV
jgi:hypothetical protein